MAKKKKYTPREYDDWDQEEDKKHRQTIREKEKQIKNKYNKWWDTGKKSWKSGFKHDPRDLGG